MKKRTHDEVGAILRHAARGGVDALNCVAAELKAEATAQRPGRAARRRHSRIDSQVEELARASSAIGIHDTGVDTIADDRG